MRRPGAGELTVRPGRARRDEDRDADRRGGSVVGRGGLPPGYAQLRLLSKPYLTIHAEYLFKNPNGYQCPTHRLWW